MQFSHICFLPSQSSVSLCSQYKIKELLYGSIDGHDASNMTMPITKILDWDTRIEVEVSKDANHISEAVKEVIEDFTGANGDSNVAGGVTKIVTNLITTVLGAASGTEKIRTKYTCYANGIGFMRLDFYAYNRTMSAKSLLQQQNSILVVVAARSALDVQQMNFNEFCSIYGGLFNDMDAAIEAAKKAKELYRMLREQENEEKEKEEAIHEMIMKAHWQEKSELEWHREREKFREFRKQKQAENPVNSILGAFRK